MRYEVYKLDQLHEECEVQIPIPESYRDCIRLVQSDYYRVYGCKVSLAKIWFTSIRDRRIKYLLWMRMAAYRGWLYPICLLRHNHFKNKFGLHIPSSTKIGWGFYIGHGIATVVNNSAIIGNNVNIGQCCTIGSNYGHAAWIGDNVYIGPNTCIVEDVQIGSNTVIGAGSVVTKSLEGESTAVGSPCKVIGGNKRPECVSRRWPIQ